MSTDTYVVNEDMVEEIANLQNEIVISCEVMSEDVATIERLETMLASHENLPESIKSDVAYCNVATENISMVCINIGLTTAVQVSLESIYGKELGLLSTEDIKVTVQKVINAVKKLFLKVIAKVKQFITKLVHNGKRLDAKVDELKKIVDDQGTAGGYEEVVMKYMDIKLNTGKVFDNVKDVDIVVPDLSAIKKYLSSFKKPSVLLNELSKDAENDLKKSEESLKMLERFAKNSKADFTYETSVAIGEAYNMVPSVVNGNIINYYNNVSNILDLISVYIVIKK